MSTSAEVPENGKKKRKKPTPTPPVAAAPPAAPPSPLVLAKSSLELKLDLACGQNVREGFEGVDLHAPSAKHRVDLLKFPWPWADASVDEIHCSHFIEHIPLRDVEERDLLAPHHPYLGKDLLFAFFDEAYRVLRPDSHMTVICPSVPSQR